MPTRVKEDPLERIARNLELLVRLKISEVKGERSQTQMILLLGGMGATGAEIASLLDVSRTTVDPILSKARASGPKSKKGARRSAKRGR